MKSENNKRLVKVFEVLQVLVKVSHASRHDDRHYESGDTVFVDREGYDLVWQIRQSESIKACDCHASYFKNNHQVNDIMALNEVTVEMPEDAQVSNSALNHSKPYYCKQLRHYTKVRRNMLQVISADH